MTDTAEASSPSMQNFARLSQTDPGLRRVPVVKLTTSLAARRTTPGVRPWGLTRRGCGRRGTVSDSRTPARGPEHSGAPVRTAGPDNALWFPRSAMARSEPKSAELGACHPHSPEAFFLSWTGIPVPCSPLIGEKNGEKTRLLGAASSLVRHAKGQQNAFLGDPPTTGSNGPYVARLLRRFFWSLALSAVRVGLPTGPR